MALTYDTPKEIDPKTTVEDAFTGRNLIVQIPLEAGPDDISVGHVKGKNPTKPDFPKENVHLAEEPVAQITVLYWEGSPGCRTVIVNGKAYEKC